MTPTTTTTVLSLLLLLLLLSTTTATTTLSSDISALKSFKSAINPTSIPSYSCLSSWNFTSDPCSTPHTTHFLCALSCSSDHRITHLTLDHPGYSGTLSPLISNLTQLITLDLSDNNFSGPIPTSIFSLPNLQTLNLRSNSFSSTLPPTISHLNYISTLDISHNSLSGSVPDTSNLLTLTRIDLSFNKFTGQIPNLPKTLIELAIKSNSLSGDLQSLAKSPFNELDLLEVIEISENSLTGTIPGWFFLLPSLQQVNLAGNRFTGIEIFKPTNTGIENENSNSLVAIDAGYNRITGYLSVNLTAYPALSSLSLRYNRLQGPIPGEFSEKGSLKRLFLDGNYLNGVPAKGFFDRNEGVEGSFGDNCLKSCPMSSELCVKSQKSPVICRQVYGGKGKLKS